MLPTLPQVKTGVSAQTLQPASFLSSARSTKSGPTLLAKTISAEQCKTEPEWVVAGKPPQALEQLTMCSCPPSQGGSREKSSSFFLLPHSNGSCHPFSTEARRVGSLLSWLQGIQTGAPWKPPECARHCNRNKTLSSSEVKSRPFYDGRGGPLVRDAGRLLA